MIIKAVKLYRCGFCTGTMSRRKKSLRRHIVARHETICFENPDRTPQPGELTQHWQEGRYVFGEDGSDFVPHSPMPKWWPGVGMIFTGSKWIPVEGYIHPFDSATGEEVWPFDGSIELPKVKPWSRRLAILDVSKDDMPDEIWSISRRFEEIG